MLINYLQSSLDVLYFMKLKHISEDHEIIIVYEKVRDSLVLSWNTQWYYRVNTLKKYFPYM